MLVLPVLLLSQSVLFSFRKGTRIARMNPGLVRITAIFKKMASTSSSSLNGAAGDQHVEISDLVLPHLDRHLALPVLNFLEEQGVYDKTEVLQAKYDLLKPTNMVLYVESIRRELAGEPEPKDGQSPGPVKAKADEILKRGEELKQKADKVIEIISNPQVAASLGQDKERNLATLKEKYSVRWAFPGRTCTRADISCIRIA